MTAATKPPASNAPSAGPAATPWWRVGTMWLVFGGPAVVVVASLGLVVTAVRHVDPVIGSGAAVTVNDRDPSLVPAMKARNHAAAPLLERDAPTQPGAARP